MGLYDFFKKAKRKVGEEIGQTVDSIKSTGSSLGSIAKSYSDSLSRKTSDYFQPTSEVRTRDFIREVPKATFDTGKSMFQGTYNVATKAPKIFGEGLAYAVDPNVREQYKKGNLDILPTISKTTPTSMLADTGRAMLEVATAGKGPKWAMGPSAVKRTAYGAGTGYGFDVLGRVADEGKVTKESFKPGTGTVLGGVFGAAAKPTTELVKESIDQVARGAKNTKRIVSQVPDAVKNSIDNRLDPKVETLPEHWVPSRKVSIRSDAAGRPDVIPAPPKGERYAGPVRNAGIDPVTQSPRFVAQTEKLMPEQRVVRQKTPTVSQVFNEALDLIPQPGMSIKAVTGGPTNKNTQAINAINAKKNAKSAAVVESMKRGEAEAPTLPLIPKKSTATPMVPKASVAESPIDKFSRELDAIPAPWGDKAPESPISPSIERDLKEMKAKGLDKKVMDNLFNEKPVGPFNEYQQAAFNKKQERIKAIKEISEAPTVLRAMGYTKKEAEKLGVEEAKIIAELGKLGYPKGDPVLRDVRSETAKRILENRVPYKTLKEYYTRKHELDTKILEGIDPKTLKDISPLQAGTRDVYRNMEDTFGPNYAKVKAELLDPFDASKGEFIRDQENWIKELEDNVVNKFGFRKGSKESAAIQRYGDTDLPEGERLSYDQLVSEFGKEKADQIVEADRWFRTTYDNMIDELNRIREYYFPTHPLYPESTKIIPKRANYYRHFQEMVDGVKGLLNIFDSPANIDPSLAVSSEFTKPLSKWLSFAKKREGKQTEIDAVGGFLDYIKANAYAKHIDPHIQRFRGVDAEMKSKLPKGEFFDDSRIGLAEELSRKMDPFEQIAGMKDVSKIKNFLIEKGLQDRDALKMAKDLADIKDVIGVKEYLGKNLSMEGFSEFKSKALAEDSGNKLNNFLKFLDNFSNDLAGKTNPIDRPVQDNFLGRQAFRAINWVNSRVKANVILGNMSSAVAQFFSIPNGIANAGVRNAVPAVGDSLIGILKNDVPSSKSVFLKERYFNGYDRFDPGVIANTKRLAVWLTSLGDKVGTTFTWNAQYRKALAEGAADPVKYADDWTRKMVAGRGIGEVPIAQKSKLIQIIAPFQLEVANQWRVFGDWAKNDPSKLALAKKLMEYSVAVWVMNRIAKEIRGSDVAFDPMEAMLDAYQSFQEEDGKLKGTMLAGGRVAGEVLSNIPFVGEPVARMYPEFGKKDVLGTGVDLPTREQFFGDKDPTRFGGGLIASKALTDPLYMLVPSFGGRQIKNTVDGVGTLMQGYAETEAGKVMTPVDATIPNIMKGVLTGKNALDEVQDYRENDQTPLSEQQTERFKIGGRDYFQEVMDSRAADDEKEILKALAKSSTPQKIESVTEQGIHQLKDGNYYVPGLLSDTKTFKTEKLAKYAIDREDFMNSDDKTREHDGNFWYKDANGDFKTKTVASRQRDLEKAKTNLEMDRAQAADDMTAWLNAANRKIQAIEKYANTLDPAIDQDEIDSLTLERENLLAKVEKFDEQGGFKKGRKLEEKYRYPLIDKDLMNIAAIRSGSKKPIIIARPPTLNRRRMRRVRKVRK